MLKLLGRLFGAPPSKPPQVQANNSERKEHSQIEGLEKLEGDGEFSFSVVGESNYQESLEILAGPKESKGKSVSCLAVIEHEPDNQWDANACPVFIDGYRVGHLAKNDAKELVSIGGEGCRYTVDALINGGYETERYSGKFGVALDFLPRQFSATSTQKEMFRFFGLKSPKGITRGEAWDKEKLLEKSEKYNEWNDFRLILSYLQSKEGREDYCIRKPSIKAIRDAFTKLMAEGYSSASLASSMDEVVEEMIDENPNLEKD